MNKIVKSIKELEHVLNESTIVSIFDKNGILLYVNNKFCEISGYKKEEVIGRENNLLYSENQDSDFYNKLWNTINNGDVWKGDVKNISKKGSFYWLDTTVVPLLDNNRLANEFISISYDITDRKEYEKYIKNMAYYDDLTSLPNRNMLTKWLGDLFDGDIDELDLTVLFIDIDYFKSINDELGHHIGDMILIEVSKRIKGCIREKDFATRQGGDEFLIFLRDMNNKNNIINLVDRLIKELTLPFRINGELIENHVSIGIASEKFNKNEGNLMRHIEETISRADNAMYIAKKTYGNSYSFSDLNEDCRLKRITKMEYELRYALDKGEYEILYQPILNLKTNGIVGVEALLRWNNKYLGKVFPNEFIPLLEKNGLIVDVGDYVFRSVFNQVNEWKRQGLNLEKVCINVSPIQFSYGKFIKNLKKIIVEENFDGNLLDIEITESTLMIVDEVKNMIESLSDFGIGISIDDFGTGYSSLLYLKKLKIDTLKIDRSFIKDLNEDDDILVNTIIDMGKNLKINVLAEGIETEEQLNYLIKRGCNEGQGFLFSKPVTAEKIFDLYKKWNKDID